MQVGTIRFDWLTVTFKDAHYDDIETLLYRLFNLDVSLFTSIKGRYGYARGLFYESVSVLFDGCCDDMGVCFEISGKGCSLLYCLAQDWEECFNIIKELDGNITRLDVAFDCFNHEIDYDVMLEAIKAHNYSSRWQKVKAIQSYGSDSGIDIQFGSRRSDIMLRIYDKLAEQKCCERDYWCRFELQLRNHLAVAYVDTYLQQVQQAKQLDDVVCATSYCDGDLFLGVLTHYLRFIDRKYDSTNTNKCPTLPWWDDFIASCRKAVILRREDYKPVTMEQLVYNVSTRFAQCYKVFLEMFGSDALLDVLSNAEVKSRHYKSLLASYNELKKTRGMFVFEEVCNAYLR